MVVKELKIQNYCTLRDHCSAVFQPIWAKFMLFWKDFFSSFNCRQPRFGNFIRLEAIPNWSWWCKGPNLTTTGRTVIWQFFAQNWWKYHFLGRIGHVGIHSCPKISGGHFRHFLRPPPSGPAIWPIWCRCRTPMGHPSHPPTWSPPYMFFLSNKPKKGA